MNEKLSRPHQWGTEVLSPLRGHWQDCLAVTNILLIPSLALNRLILRLKSSLINEPVNSETQVPVFSWETGLRVLSVGLLTTEKAFTDIESFTSSVSFILVHMRARSNLWQLQRQYLCTDAAGSHKNLKCWLLLVCLPHGSDLIWMYDTLVGDRRNAWTNPTASPF